MISITDVFSLINQGQSMFLNSEKRKTLNRLLLVEVNHNINIINLLPEELEQFSLEYYSIFNLLETDYLIAYMAEPHGEFFKNILDSQSQKNDFEKDDLISNIILKIKILRSISLLKSSDISSKKFRLKLRIKNLKGKLEQLGKQLDN